MLSLETRSVTQQCVHLSSNYGGLLPADLDGTITPPFGSPNFSLAFGTNVLQFRKFHVDWTTTNNSTLTGPAIIPVATFSEACKGGVCNPQTGTQQQLDSLGNRLMYRLAYRHFSDGHEALVVNHSADAGSGIVRIRWYELRNPTGTTMANGTPVHLQRSTYASDSTYRWMRSIAMDKVGNIALGYSVSTGSLDPGIRYASRASEDPSDLLGIETTLVKGIGSQARTLNQWGHYSRLSIDPTDDCTFWYTNEYLNSDGTFNWSTRIASFKFTTCQ